MISKTGTIQLFLTLFIAIITLVGCINDPSNKNWNPEDEFKIEYIPQIEKLLCSKDGRFYGLAYNYVITFDSTTLSGKIPSSKLQYSEGASNIFLDKNQDLIVFGDFGVKRYRFAVSGLYIDDLDIRGKIKNTIYTANEDSNFIIGVTREKQLISWDGASLSYHGILWNEDIIVGMFHQGSSFDVFTNQSDYSVRHTIINDTSYTLKTLGSDYYYRTIITIDSTYIVRKSDTDSIWLNMIMKKWGVFFGTGTTIRDNVCSFALFTISADDMLSLFCVLPVRMNEYVQTNDAIYLCGGNYLFKITGDMVYQAEMYYDIEGPLFLDHNDRPAIYYIPTHRIFHVDSLSYSPLYQW